MAKIYQGIWGLTGHTPLVEVCNLEKELNLKARLHVKLECMNGDEAGMEGYKDPFNRVCYPWGNENGELLSWYRELGSFRRGNSVFIDGEFEPVSEADGVIAYIRKNEKQKVMVILNRNADAITYYLSPEWQSADVALGGEKCDGGVAVDGIGYTVLIKGE